MITQKEQHLFPVLDLVEMHRNIPISRPGVMILRIEDVAPSDPLILRSYDGVDDSLLINLANLFDGIGPNHYAVIQARLPDRTRDSF